MGAYAQIGERLIERGFAAIPIMPGTKRPGFYHAGQWLGLSNWQRRFRRGAPPEAERMRWADGNSGVGIITGPASRGTVAIDIDTDDPKIMAAITGVLPPTPIKKRGAKGETLFYYAPHIEASTSWTIDGHRVVDPIGPGRQTVLPPTQHPDTDQPYVWTGSGALEDIEPGELPELETNIITRISAALAPFGYQSTDPQAARGNGGDGDSPHRQLNDMALANLSAWVPALGLYRCRRTKLGFEAVPMWRPSTTGRPPEKRHLNLKIVPAGIRDFGADKGYTPLDLVMTALCCDLQNAWQYLSERLGFAGEAMIVEPPAAPAAAKPQPEPLEAFTHVPGVVGDIVDWIVATARRPNRVLALGAAITIVGTLIGRRVAGPTQSATHLYVIPVGPTGSGKQHLLDATMALMRGGDAHGHIGPSEFISMPAVLNFIQRKPLALCLQDEYGAFLHRITSKKASGFEQAISKVLRSLWATSFMPMATPEWASREMKIIQSPAISILGLSTSEEFHGALQGDHVANGFLNRFLVLNSDVRAAAREPKLEPGKVPSQLRAKLQQLYFWSGPESLLQIDNPEAAYVPDMLPWASEPAAASYDDFERMRDEYMDEKPSFKPYIARAGEIAIRLATIRAAGRLGRRASIDRDDIEWGIGVAWTAGLVLANTAMDYTPESERRTWGDKIRELIGRRGPLKVRDIQQHIRSALRSAEIKDILAQSVEAGFIEWTADGYRQIIK
jgi:Bifunctional DNA primase/polymerase, N-terminal